MQEFCSPVPPMPSSYSKLIWAGAILLTVSKRLDLILYCLANLTPGAPRYRTMRCGCSVRIE